MGVSCGYVTCSFVAACSGSFPLCCSLGFIYFDKLYVIVSQNNILVFVFGEMRFSGFYLLGYFCNISCPSASCEREVELLWVSPAYLYKYSYILFFLILVFMEIFLFLKGLLRA
jgi:hypothetical protein